MTRLMLLTVIPTPHGPRYRVAPAIPHARFGWVWTEGDDYEIAPSEFARRGMTWAKPDEAREMIAQYEYSANLKAENERLRAALIDAAYGLAELSRGWLGAAHYNQHHDFSTDYVVAIQAGLRRANLAVRDALDLDALSKPCIDKIAD